MTLFFFSVLADCALHGDIVLCTSYWGHLRVTWWLNFPQVLQCFCTLEHRRWDKTSLHFWGSATGFRMTSVGFCSKTHKRKTTQSAQEKDRVSFYRNKVGVRRWTKKHPGFFPWQYFMPTSGANVSSISYLTTAFFFTLPSPEASDASFHKDLRVVNLPPLQCSVRKTNLDIHGNSRLSSPRNLASLISERGSHPASSAPCRPSQVNHRLSRVQMDELRTNF